jgi:hypothetical protein
VLVALVHIYSALRLVSMNSAARPVILLAGHGHERSHRPGLPGLSPHSLHAGWRTHG